MLFRQVRRHFSKGVSMPEIFSNPTYYSENQEKCLNKTGIDEFKFTFHGKEIDVYGLPLELESQALRNQYIIDVSEIGAGIEDSTVLLQLDPVFHMYEKRSIKSQINQQVKFQGKKQEDLLVNESPIIPQNLGELKLEPYLLEMSKATPEELQTILEIVQNKDIQKAEQFQGYFSKYFNGKNSEQLESDEGQAMLMELAQQIQKQITNNLESNQNDFVTLMVLNILKGNQIYLGDVPSIYYRIILGDRMNLFQLRDIYKQILNFMKDNQTDEIEGLYEMLMGQIFQQPVDLYLYYLLQKLSMDSETNSISCFVKNTHIEPLKIMSSHFGDNGFMKDSSFQEFMMLKQDGQSGFDEEKIEKHALLENIFGTKMWEQNYIKNKFPYINEDFNSLGEGDKLAIEKLFFANYNKYQELKNKILKL